MSRINGIGGVFISIPNNSDELLKWYDEVLEVDTSEYGISFLEPNIFTLITFTSSKNNKTVLNFTVDNLDMYMNKLRKKNVKIIKEIQQYSYGKFAQIEDIYGDTIELWEPDYDGYLEMVKNEIEKQKNKSI